MSQLLGRAFIKANGKLLRTNDGAKIDLGGIERTSVVGNEVHGYAEKPKQSRLECEISLGKGDSVEEIRNLTDATVTFEADTGQTYIQRDAFTAETLEVNQGDGGKIKVVIEGMPAEEMT